MSKQPLWTSDAMASAMHAATNGPLPRDVFGISIDSRTLAPGDAYFAIKGDVHDGHAFVEAALKAGAALAVVEAAQRDTFAADAPLLIVDDVLDGLRELGRAARARLEGQVIAVTGSVGKTSTKEALRGVLGTQGETHASVASFNNHWGVPLTLARCPASARYAVFEIGMNHAGEIEPLVKMVRPHVAIITTVEPVHLEFFSGIEGIADAKAEIFAGLEPGGAAVLNRDNAMFARLSDNAAKAGVKRIVSFGVDPTAEARLLDVALHADCSAVHANILGHDVTYKLGIPGRHIAMNSLAVLAAAELVGADLALAALALSQVQPAAGRGVRRPLELRHGQATLIDESYNANPARRGGENPGNRPGVLLRAADAAAVGRPFLREAGRLCRDRGRARISGRRGSAARRRADDQGFARLAHENDCHRAREALFRQGRARRCCGVRRLECSIGWSTSPAPFRP